MRPCLQIEYGENRQKINFLRLQAWRSRHRQGRPHPLPLVVSRGSSNSSSSGGSRGGGKPWEEGGREEEAPTQTQPLRKLPSPTRSTSSMSRSEFKEIFDEARSRLRSSSASVPSSSSSSSSSSSASSSSSSSSNFQPSHPPRRWRNGRCRGPPHRMARSLWRPRMGERYECLLSQLRAQSSGKITLYAHTSNV
jgi:hypothetical protein